MEGEQAGSRCGGGRRRPAAPPDPPPGAQQEPLPLPLAKGRGPVPLWGGPIPELDGDAASATGKGTREPRSFRHDDMGPVLLGDPGHGGAPSGGRAAQTGRAASVATEGTRYRFGPLERRGLVAGWRGGQIASVAGGLVVAVLVLRSRPTPVSVVVALVTVVGGVALACWPVGAHRRGVAPDGGALGGGSGDRVTPPPLGGPAHGHLVDADGVACEAPPGGRSAR